MHKSCYISISSSSKLESAIKRKAKSQTSLSFDSDKENEDDNEVVKTKLKRLRSSGPLYHNNKCVWCLQGEDPKHPDRACGRLHKMTTDTAWKNFKNHISRIDDSQLSDCLSRLVHSISDPQASKIKYHLSCWKKYVTSHDLSLHPQNSLVKCRVMLPENIAKIIIPLHIISGSDHTSAFFGHGKKKLLKKCMHDPQSADLLQRVG